MKFEDYVVIDFVPIKKSDLPKLEERLSKSFYLDNGIYYTNYVGENGKHIPVFDINKGPINYKNKEYFFFHTALKTFIYKSVADEYFENSLDEGIKQFDNFASYLDYTPYKEDKDIAALYSKQMERYKAIASGQYQEYRLNIYKREYIKALEGVGMDDLAKLLRNMSTSNFKRLADNAPNPNREKKSGTLPSISVLYRYSASGVAGYIDNDEELSEFRAEFYESLKETFGKEKYHQMLEAVRWDGFYSDDDFDSWFSEEPITSPIARRTSFKGHSTLLFSKRRNIYRSMLETKSEEELRIAEFEELFERERKNKLYAISSKGEVYIRGKSKAFMKEYVEYSKSRWRALGVKTI